MDSPFVLHISDSPTETERIAALLDSFQFPSVTVTTIKEGINQLNILRPSIILLSLTPNNILEWFSGIKELAGQALERLTPLLIISESQSDLKREQLFDQGAFDFVARPIDPQLFQHLLQGRIAFKRKLEQALSKRERLDECITGSTFPRKVEMILIDDDPIILEILKQQFISLQMENSVVEVKTFKNGADFIAANWYNPDHYYAIILDGVMPKMTGFEVLTHIRSSYPQKNILIFMLTAKVGQMDIQHSLEAGADDYITKPFRPKEVALRVQRLMKRLFK
ncbi:DNA-binding response OmpR family regulator [Sporosarcina luteola]|nr:DNA-binding response OmpR family regulator [Sporosarcina luteola]